MERQGRSVRPIGRLRAGAAGHSLLAAAQILLPLAVMLGVGAIDDEGGRRSARATAVLVLAWSVWILGAALTAAGWAGWRQVDARHPRLALLASVCFASAAAVGAVGLLVGVAGGVLLALPASYLLHVAGILLLSGIWGSAPEDLDLGAGWSSPVARAPRPTRGTRRAARGSAAVVGDYADTLLGESPPAPRVHGWPGHGAAIAFWIGLSLVAASAVFAAGSESQEWVLPSRVEQVAWLLGSAAAVAMGAGHVLASAEFRARAKTRRARPDDLHLPKGTAAHA